jgi:hypothetical protein
LHPVRSIKWICASSTSDSWWTRWWIQWKILTVLTAAFWVGLGFIIANYPCADSHGQLTGWGGLVAGFLVCGIIGLMFGGMAFIAESTQNVTILWRQFKLLGDWKEYVDPLVTGPQFPVDAWRISWPTKVIGRETVEFSKKFFVWHSRGWDVDNYRAACHGTEVITAPVDDSSKIVEIWVDLCAECKKENVERYRAYVEQMDLARKAQESIDIAVPPLTEAKKLMSGL